MCSRRRAGSCFSLRPTTSLPATRTLPEVAVRMHPMIESSVVLPLPEGPISISSSPGWTSTSTPRSARVPLEPSSYFLTSCRTAIADCIFIFSRSLLAENLGCFLFARPVRRWFWNPSVFLIPVDGVSQRVLDRAESNAQLVFALLATEMRPVALVFHQPCVGKAHQHRLAADARPQLAGGRQREQQRHWNLSPGRGNAGELLEDPGELAHFCVPACGEIALSAAAFRGREPHCLRHVASIHYRKSRRWNARQFPIYEIKNDLSR